MKPHMTKHLIASDRRLTERHRPRKRMWRKLLIAPLVFLCSGIGLAQATTLNAIFMKQAAYSESNVRDMTAAFEKTHPGVKVDLTFVPYEALHDKIITSVASGGGYDVVLYDVIWLAQFAQDRVLRNLSSDIPKSTIDEVMPGAWTSARYQGRYYGLPWILDTKYLFYNKEMLKKAGISSPPTSWQEVLADAKIIKAKGLVQYPIDWSWQQAEALICDYTTLLDAFDGQFFTKDGKPAFQTGGGLKALQYMVQSLKDGVSNPASTQSLEDDVRRVFSSGQAAFALNWTYMYDLANNTPSDSNVVGQVGVEPAPGMSKPAAVNGSMGLGVTTTSQHPKLAYEYVQFLTSYGQQAKYAKLSLPIWKRFYSQPGSWPKQDVQLVEAAKKSLSNLYPRPPLVNYTQFSNILQKEIQLALLGKKTPKQALDDAAQEVVQAGANR